MKSILSLLFILFTCFFLSSSNYIGKIYYTIDDSSSLAIEGTSNVTGFECRCNQGFAPSALITEVFDNGKRAMFRDGKLAIETRSFDCGQKGINKDMHNALKADAYPYITIELIEVLQKSTFVHATPGEWLLIKAKANLTIAECTQKVDLEIKGMELDSGHYRFVCSENIKMTSFNIDPPRPLMGLIKVDDDITIKFDLIVNLMNV